MKIYCTFHPSSVEEGGFQLEQYIREDFARFRRKQLTRPKQSFPTHGAKVVGFDTEYDPNGNLLTVGLATDKKAGAIETTDKHWRRRVSSILKRAKVIVGHSVDGDLDYLVRYGLAKEDWLRGRNVWDSLLLARMLDENRGKGGYNLESLLLSEFNFHEWKRDTAALLKKTGDASSWSVEQRTERCRLDAWATRLLGEEYLGRVRAQTEAVQEERLEG